MSRESSSSFSYDEFPYSSYPYAHTHPRNLAALAQLFSMNPADVSQCRVLEIGCAAGGNLIPMAARFPESEFHGLDASGRQIDEGTKLIDSLSLGNITLRHQDILDFDPGSGKFDYIICHGVYSWVPPAVQAKILSVCRDHLAESGVAYVSYNTYPGWYLRQGVREMMSYHASGFDDSQTKINQSRALVDFLAGAVKRNEDSYEKLLHEELSILRSSEDSYIFHEHLEAINEPLFFHQFVSRAEECDLRFMCEANFVSMLPNEYSEETQKTLAEIAPDLVQMEQYLDFLRNRKFRQSLLCHREVRLDRAIEPSRLKGLFVNSPLATTDSDEADGSESSVVFEHASGSTLTVGNAIQKAAFQHLAAKWPGDVSIEELASVARQSLSEDQQPSHEECCQELYETLLELYSSSLIALAAAPSGCTSAIDEIPLSTNLIRHQATQGYRVTNIRHESVYLDEFEREIVKRLDGKTTIDEITTQVLDLSVTISNDGGDHETVSEPIKPTHEELKSAIQNRLARLMQTALLSDQSVAR